MFMQYHPVYTDAYLRGGSRVEYLDAEIGMYRSIQQLVDHLVGRCPKLLADRYDNDGWIHHFPTIDNVFVYGQYGYLQLNWKKEPNKHMAHFCPIRSVQEDSDDRGLQNGYHLRNTSGVRFNFAQRNIVYVCWDDACIDFVSRRWWQHVECQVCNNMPQDIIVANQHCGRTTVMKEITSPRWFADDI